VFHENRDFTIFLKKYPLTDRNALIILIAFLQHLAKVEKKLSPDKALGSPL